MLDKSPVLGTGRGPIPATVLVKVLQRLRPIRMHLQREREKVEKGGGGERGVKGKEEEEGKEAGREERDCFSLRNYLLQLWRLASPKSVRQAG